MQKSLIKALLGTELPIIQSPMAGVQDSALAIAVSNAGGLGSLPCGMLSIEKMVSEITLIKNATSKPYNLNFFCHEMPDYNPEQHHHWQKVLKPYFDELGIVAEHTPSGASRLPFNGDIADAIAPFHPEFISFHFGLPDKKLLALIKSWGTKVVSSATTVNEALWLESQGVDGIIAQGLEAGGHRGMFLSEDLATQINLSALVPQMTNKVTVPVIAAGGISNQHDVQNAFQLGVDAVQIGTAYLLCSEATTSPLHRTAIKNTCPEQTALTTIFSGKPARGIINRVMNELAQINPLAPTYPYAAIEMAQLRNHAEKQELSDFSPLWCGKNTTGCQEISAGELTRILMAGYLTKS